MKSRSVYLIVLTVWAVAGSYIALMLMGVATFTNRWIYTKETIEKDFRNGTLKVIIELHSGLLEFCRDNVSYKWLGHPSYTPVNVSESSLKILYSSPGDPGCFSIRASLPEPGQTPKDVNSAVLAHVVKVLPLPICSFLLLIVTSVISTVGLFFPQRRCLMFICGATHVVAGLCSLTGLIRYIIAVNDAVIEKHPVSPDKLFFHFYGISFVIAVLAFFLINTTGVASLYLYIRHEKMAVRSEKERLRHHLMTMSTCATNSPDIDIEVTTARDEEGSPLRPAPDGIDDYQAPCRHVNNDVVQSISIEL